MASRSGRRDHPSTRGGGDLSRGDYLGLTLLVTVALIGTALFMAYLLEKRGMVSPGTVVGDLMDEGGDGAGEPGTSP